MKIGYIVKRYPRYSETFIVNEILAHEAAGLDVRIFALLPPEDTHFQDIIARVRAPVRYLPPRAGKAKEMWAELTKVANMFPTVWKTLSTSTDASARELLQAMILVQEIRNQGITHLHAHFATSATTVARLAAGICGINYSFTAHAKDIFHEDVDMETLRAKFSDASAVITVSDYNVDYLHNSLGAAASGVQRIYNGLDLERFPYTSPDTRRPQIVAVGRLVEKKGFGYLIDACELLTERGVEYSCRIIGSGDEGLSLHSRIIELGLEQQVELSGPKPQQDVIAALQNAAVFAAPCVVGDDGNRDGLPTVLLESMALGTPCISTDVTGIPEILRDGDTGLLVAQKDPSALADALERLLINPDLRVSTALNARTLIESEFDVHTNAACLRSCFSCNDVTQLDAVVAV